MRFLILQVWGGACESAFLKKQKYKNLPGDVNIRRTMDRVLSKEHIIYFATCDYSNVFLLITRREEHSGEYN